MYKLVDAALAGDAKRAVRILGGLRAEGVEPVIIFWALGRELRLLAGLADAVERRTDLGSAMQKASPSPPGMFERLLKAVGEGDAAAKGQLRADPWQLASDVVLGLAFAGKRAA